MIEPLQACLSGSVPTLRPYQATLVDRLRDAYRAGYRAALLPAAGKPSSSLPLSLAHTAAASGFWWSHTGGS
jgi:hypothetical protein